VFVRTGNDRRESLMFRLQSSSGGSAPTLQRRARRALALAVGGSAVVAAVALAGGAPILGATRNAQVKKTIVVNAQGRTVYVLSPETAKHLLCTSKQCLSFWPPVTVTSRSVKLTRGSGVEGRLGLLSRSGKLQVTLNGMPLYTFKEDTRSGQANGEGIKSFGGTWHTVPAS
jgi:predicted lipoprotein with Yx(FWY)xxD motif